LCYFKYKNRYLEKNDETHPVGNWLRERRSIPVGIKTNSKDSSINIPRLRSFQNIEAFNRDLLRRIDKWEEVDDSVNTENTRDSSDCAKNGATLSYQKILKSSFQENLPNDNNKLSLWRQLAPKP